MENISEGITFYLYKQAVKKAHCTAKLKSIEPFSDGVPSLSYALSRSQSLLQITQGWSSSNLHFFTKIKKWGLSEHSELLKSWQSTQSLHYCVSNRLLLELSGLENVRQAIADWGSLFPTSQLKIVWFPKAKGKYICSSHFHSFIKQTHWLKKAAKDVT